MNTPTYSHARDDATETSVLRYMSGCLALPALCRTKGCRRTRKCKGEPRECLARYAPLVPEDAREWMKAALEGLQEDRDFEEVREDYPDEFAAFIAWREAVEHAYPPQALKKTKPRSHSRKRGLQSLTSTSVAQT